MIIQSGKESEVEYKYCSYTAQPTLQRSLQREPLIKCFFFDVRVGDSYSLAPFTFTASQTARVFAHAKWQKLVKKGLCCVCLCSMLFGQILPHTASNSLYPLVGIELLPPE
jgi:hypothetical protein